MVVVLMVMVVVMVVSIATCEDWLWESNPTAVIANTATATTDAIANTFWFIILA